MLFFTMPAPAQARASRLPLALMAGGTAILIAIVVVSMLLAAQTVTLSADMGRARTMRTAVSTELETLLNAETGQRGYLVTMRDNYLQPYLAARNSAQESLKQLMAVEAANPAMQPQLRALTAVSAEKLAELEDTVELARAGHRDQAMDLVLSDRGKNLMDQARAPLRAMLADADQHVANDLARLNANALLMRTVTIGGGMVILLFSGAAVWLLLRYIRDALRARKEVEALNASLEDRVARRTAALTRANEEIQRFAYIVSHDLRAPLVNIMGFTSELEVGGKMLKAFFETGENRDAAQEAAVRDLPESVGFIRSSTGKMDRLINAILKLSREGRRELTAEPVNLNTVFETILASLKHQIDETSTQVELSPLLPTLQSDRLALEQVFSNLADNALKYLQPGRPGRLKIEATNMRSGVVIKVIDNGRGIAEQDLERVFELFRRAGRQDKPGEGIGLAHVRALVRRMGGDITVRSRLGEGSEFRVQLPRSLPIEQSNPS
jgi:signal transduction histidine kinase